MPKILVLDSLHWNLLGDSETQHSCGRHLEAVLIDGVNAANSDEKAHNTIDPAVFIHASLALRDVPAAARLPFTQEP